MSLSHLLALAFELPADSPLEEVQEVLARLRAALAAGLEAQKDELRSFMTLADRFGSHADAWNAAPILGRSGTLDPHAKAIQASAWIKLFPESARTRPRTLLSILGPDGRAGLTSAALGGILTRWIDGALVYERPRKRWAVLSQTEQATAELAACWWPEKRWPIDAPAFASTFTDAAMELARIQPEGSVRENLRMARVFATALVMRGQLDRNADEGNEVSYQAGVEGGNPDFSAKPIDALTTKPIERLNVNPRRIWLVGAIRPKWEHLMGIAKSLGLDPALFRHIGYDELKTRPLLKRVDLVRDFGVLLGPTPHNVAGVDGIARLSSQLQREAGIRVIELRTQSDSQELRISKSSFRSELDRLLADASVCGVMPWSPGLRRGLQRHSQPPGEVQDRGPVERSPLSGSASSRLMPYLCRTHEC